MILEPGSLPVSMNGKEHMLSFQSIVSHFQEYVCCYFYHLKDDTMWLNLCLPIYNGLPLCLRRKESDCNEEDPGSIRGSGRCP